MAMFTEQTALDHGKLQFSWLLTGFSEPSHAVLSAPPGLKPLSRLANVFFLIPKQMAFYRRFPGFLHIFEIPKLSFYKFSWSFLCFSGNGFCTFDVTKRRSLGMISLGFVSEF